jgi:transcriptional regulator with XRE-family HTH domain
MRIRRATKLDQTTFGARMGVGESTVSRWENGIRKPTRGQAIDALLRLRAYADTDLVMLRQLAAGWGVDPDEIGIPDPEADEDEDAASRVDARRVVQDALFAASEDSDLSVRVLRRVLETLLATLEAGGVSVAEARAAAAKP